MSKKDLRRPIVVLDFGAQYSKLIARRVREANVYSVIVPYNVDLETLRAMRPAGLIFSGRPSSVMSSFHWRGSITGSTVFLLMP